MLLSDDHLQRALDLGELGVAPTTPELLQPASIDVRLGRRFGLMVPPELGAIDPSQAQPELFRQIDVPRGEPFVLRPRGFALATTFERITLGSNLAARIEGKSSLGRLGYRVHSTAGFLDPGFDGPVTLELSNDGVVPILWWPGMAVGQLCVFRLSSRPRRIYGDPGLGSRYQGQQGPTASRAFLRWRTWADEVYAVD